MTYLLLLVNSAGEATTSPLVIRELREFPGNEGLSVHFRPVRNDLLFESAKAAGRLAYRILSGEGIVRSQLWVEYELPGAHVNVTGRSSDLLFALALITAKWKRADRPYPAIAATGVLDAEGAALATEGASTVQGVKHTVEKVAAAVSALIDEPEAIVFYPTADAESVATWSVTATIPAHIRLHAVASLEDALSVLGISLEKVYLGNPFRGLEHFDYPHRAIFFGRDTEIAEVMAQLLRREAAGSPGLLVDGASGSGKSSFLRAGVLPTLVHPGSQPRDIEQALQLRPVHDTVRRAIWRIGLLPGTSDEAKMVRSIVDCWQTLPELAGCFGAETATLDDLARRRRERWPASQRFVWLLDQFEELFTLGLPDSLVDTFGRFLISLQSEGVWTLTSIRADAVPQLKQYPNLRQVFGSNEGQYYLASISATALDDVINRPAQAAGLSFGIGPSGRRLDHILREDAYRDRGNALPLLQFTLYELYQRRSARELTYAAYEQLGGLAGSVSTTADAVLKTEAVDDRAVSHLFRGLVTVDEFGGASRRYAPIAELARDPEQKRLLLRLVAARLCVTDQREGQSVVAFAHEALLRTWPALLEWLKEETSLLKARELAERECRLWEARNRSSDWLATRDKLALLEPLMSAGLPLPGAVSEFIVRSERRVRRVSALKSIAVASIMLLAVLASAMGWEASRKAVEAQYQAAQARRAQLRAETEARTASATAEFLSTIFDAPTPENSLGRLITARELLDTGAQRLNATLVSAPDVKARLTERIGKAYRELGEYDRARPLLEGAVAQYSTLSNTLPEDRAEALTETARLYDRTDLHDRARTMLIEAARWEEMIPTDRRSAMSYIFRAEIETAGADFHASQTALERATEILAARRQPEDRENYELPLHYSRLYLEQGKFAEAERFGLEAIIAERRILGDADPSAVSAALNMQLLYLQMQTPARAEPYGRRARDMAQAIYGPQHPSYAGVLMEYANTLGAMGRPKDAELLMREALKIRLGTLGPDNTSTGYSYYNLGNAVADQGRNAEALPLIIHSQHIWEVSEGPEHPDVAWALDMEARLLTALGRAAESIPLAMKARAISEKVYGAEHPNVGRSWMRIGDAKLQLGEYQASVEAYQHATQIFEHTYGPDGPRVGEILEKYSKALRAAGRSREAVAAHARAAGILRLGKPSD
jgi:tetratricopeptide (TPR) repeat protein